MTDRPKRRPRLFRQTDLMRAIKAARGGGLDIDRVEIEPAGSIVIHCGKAGGDAQGSPLDEWLDKKNAR